MSSSTDDTLINKKCVPCHGGVSALTPAEAQKKLGLLESGWQLVEDGKASGANSSSRTSTAP